MFKKLILLGALAGLLTTTSTVQADVWEIDPVHSSVLAGVKHLGVATVWGRFDDFSGTVNLTEGEEAVEFTVKTSSVNTAIEKRDTHLRSADFFDVEKHTTATFKSTKVTKVDAETYEVTGDFTVMGISKPVTTQVKITGQGKGMQGEDRIGFGAKFSVKRSDFGMDFMQGPLSDEVKIRLSVAAAKKP